MPIEVVLPGKALPVRLGVFATHHRTEMQYLVRKSRITMNGVDVAINVCLELEPVARAEVAGTFVGSRVFLDVHAWVNC